MLRAAIDHPKYGSMIKELHGLLIGAETRAEIQSLDHDDRSALLREIISRITDDPLEQVFLVGEAWAFCREALGFEFYERA